MTLYISLENKRIPEIDFCRFKTSFFLFSEMLSGLNNLHKQNTKCLFYKYLPLQELNDNFEKTDFEFGLLENYKEKLISLKEETANYGFEITSEIRLDNKKFNLIFRLLPRTNPYPYDIVIEILDNGYAYTLEDLEQYYPQFRRTILERIKFHNHSSVPQDRTLLHIQRAFMSDFTEDLDNLDEWRLMYSRNPQEFIIYITNTSEELTDRLKIANKTKFANSINNLNSFYLKSAQYAKEAQVEIFDGSLCILPKDENAMKEFVTKLREKIDVAAKNIYMTEEEYEEKLEEAFVD